MNHTFSWSVDDPDGLIVKFHGMMSCLLLFYYEDNYQALNAGGDDLCKHAGYDCRFYLIVICKGYYELHKL